MFTSKVRNVVIPQVNHAYLAGILAFHWGNQDYDKPKLSFDSFVKAVGNHHFGYGFLDTINFLELGDEGIVDVFKKDCEATLEDPLSELIIKFHNMRLIKGRLSRIPSDIIQKYLKELESQIEKDLSKTNVPKEDFLWIDRLVDVCDRISFEFCFESPVTTKKSVYKKLEDKEQVDIEYKIEPNGVIKVSPWPFSKTEITGYIQGYKSKAYPSKLEPVNVPFRLISDKNKKQIS